jgi:hypothetical protein
VFQTKSKSVWLTDLEEPFINKTIFIKYCLIAVMFFGRKVGITKEIMKKRENNLNNKFQPFSYLDSFVSFEVKRRCNCSYEKIILPVLTRWVLWWNSLLLHQTESL